MALVFRSGVKHQFRSGWRTVSRDPVIDTKPYRQLRRELDLHLDGETQGRSFLIAGHRGAGKTAMVQTVVDDVRDSIFRAIETGGPRPLRRPVLIRLYGPALLWEREVLKAETGSGTATPSGASEGAGKAEEAKHATGEGKEASANDATGATGEVKPGKAAPIGASANEPMLGALVLITVALYRALAAEIMEGFLIAARSGVKGRLDRGLPPSDLPELAAKLQLDIDAGADPSTLRAFWSRLDQPAPPARLVGADPTGPAPGHTGTEAGLLPALPPSRRLFDDAEHRLRAQSGSGCLGLGVLWPPEKGSELPNDRGLREITTLVTAAQAFRVCIGKLTASEVRKEATTREAKAETSASLGLRDLAQKLVALVAGVGIGVGVNAQSAHPGWAAVAGLAAAITTSLTLGRSSSRSFKGERGLSYTFLPEYSIQSLDRDLPIIIDRIRSVGLQPVFLVDELDKLVDEGNPDVTDRAELLDKAMLRLMHRMKQLTTDSGFFCFLTDRDYFDRVESKINESIYAIEHSFFTHRLLVAHQPSEVAAYVRSAVSASPPGEAPSPAAEILALMFGRVAMHRSRLNATDLVRAMSVMADGASLDREGEAAFQTRQLHRLETIVQLAIEHVMRQPRIGRRIDDKPRFVQVAGDVCYMISRAWERGDPKVTITPATVEAQVARRMRLRADSEKPLTPADLDAFLSCATGLAHLLCNFDALEVVLLKDAGLDQRDKPLLGVFQPPLTPLLRPSEEAGDYLFCWDAFGLLSGGETAPFDREGIQRVQDFVSVLANDFELDVADLVGADLLPPTLTDASIGQAASRLLASDRADYAARKTDEATINGLDKVLVERGPALTAVLALTRHVSLRAAGRRSRVSSDERHANSSSALRCVRRYLDVPGLIGLEGEALRHAITNDLLHADHILQPLTLTLSRERVPGSGEWVGELAGVPTSVVGPGTREEGWTFWFERVDDYLAGRPTGRARLVDVVLASEDSLPGSLFRRDLSQLTVADWSRLVLEGALFGDVPTWAIPAGLHALGFGRRMLLKVSGMLTNGRRPALREEPETIAFANRLAEEAADIGPGLLDIVSQPGSLTGLPERGEQPILRVHVDHIERYASSLAWLQSLKAFEGRMDDGLAP